MAYDAELHAAHRHSSGHRAVVLASPLCGCFHCVAVFRPDEILEWVDADAEGVGQTALCPRCGVDSVIGSKTGVSVDKPFLKQMRNYWF